MLFKTFDYGIANGTGDWRLGRMWRASRYNYVWIGPNPYTVTIEETYTRGGPAGAVTARATQAYLDGGAIEGFTQGWAYDQLGNVSTLTYPRCTSSGCNGTSTAVADHQRLAAQHPDQLVEQPPDRPSLRQLGRDDLLERQRLQPRGPRPGLARRRRRPLLRPQEPDGETQAIVRTLTK